MKALPVAKQQWVSKAATKFLLDGTNMRRWGLRSQAKCPRCPCPVEDRDHIFRCPAESAIKQWEKTLEELDTWLKSTQTHPQLRKDIIEGLRQWHDQTSGCRQIVIGSMAGQLQDQIGWGLALEGCIAKGWRKEQEAYWKGFKSRRSSRRWTIALLTRLMMMAWDMWEHQNKALHEVEENRQIILEAELNQHIREVYGQGLRHLPHNSYNILKCSQARILQFSAPYKQQWLASVEAAKARFS